MPDTYTAPVDQLLTLGDPRPNREWSNYPDLGLTQAHVPELIRMATDDALHWADEDSPDVWAPLHAWRALGQLRSEDAIEPLLSLLDEYEDEDWVNEELPVVYSMIGASALPALANFLADASHGIWSRITAAHSVEQIGMANPEARKEAISVLTEQLKQFAVNDPEFNGFLVNYLVDLRATGAVATMRRAFQQDCVDCTIMGDFQDVEIKLGLREYRLTPPVHQTIRERYFPGLDDFEAKLASVVKAPPKVGRNAPCPCGSGKKYKKCCLNKAE